MRAWVVLAGVNGLMAVGLGAYAAHGLAGDAYAQALGQQASQYQLIHALASLAADRLAAEGRRLAHGAAALFLLGLLLFSGTLYWRALNGGAPFPVPMITPAGGVSFMVGWLVLALTGLTRRR